MRLHRSLIFIILSFVYLLFLGCSSSGGDGGTAASTDINIAGTWFITETDKVDDCPESTPTQSFSLLVEQAGTSSTVTITDPQWNETYTGTLNDHTLTWSGSYEQDAPDGTVTLNPMTAIIAADCNSLNGEAKWTFVGGGVSCSGTTTFTGTREPAIGCGTATSGTPTGVWEGTFTEPGAGSINVAGIVQGNQIRLISDSLIEASAGTITVSGVSFTASMTDYDFGEANGLTTSLTGTFTAGSAMSGTFDVTDGTSGTFSLTYDPVTDKGSSLAATTGIWTGGGLELTVDNAGAISGDDTSSCIYQGTVSIIDAAVNIYGLSTTVSNCGTANGTYNGYAVISDTSGLTNNTLNFVLHNSSFLVVGELFK